MPEFDAEPATLVRAARDFARREPSFALEVGLVARGICSMGRDSSPILRWCGKLPNIVSQLRRRSDYTTGHDSKYRRSRPYRVLLARVCKVRSLVGSAGRIRSQELSTTALVLTATDVDVADHGAEELAARWLRRSSSSS